MPKNWIFIFCSPTEVEFVTKFFTVNTKYRFFVSGGDCNPKVTK